jgi:hypothetical protein
MTFDVQVWPWPQVFTAMQAWKWLFMKKKENNRNDFKKQEGHDGPYIAHLIIEPLN